ncbi:hypothetical protein ACS0TY_020635 [Phlomoides rotata]
MHSGFEIPPGIQHQHQQENSTCAPVLLSTNPTHFLEQIHTLPATQQLFLDPHHFLTPHHHPSRLSHYYAAASPPYFPVNFKLGLNERNDYKAGSGINAAEEDALLRGSERYEIPHTRQSSLGMLHCWQNQQDSTNKQSPFWEPLPEEVSNENSEIVDKQEMNQRETLTACLDSKNRVHFGELEAIYNRIGTTTESTTQTCPSQDMAPVNAHLPAVGFDHGSEASIGEEASRKTMKKKKKKKKKIVDPTAEFFGKLVQQVMDHQENLQKKFVEVIERLEEERREREEAWRNQELEHFEREAEARVLEKALAMSREDMIVSYLEKLTGDTINFHLSK